LPRSHSRSNLLKRNAQSSSGCNAPILKLNGWRCYNRQMSDRHFGAAEHQSPCGVSAMETRDADYVGGVAGTCTGSASPDGSRLLLVPQEPHVCCGASRPPSSRQRSSLLGRTHVDLVLDDRHLNSVVPKHVHQKHRIVSPTG
jgi:hypothetical protein